MQGETNIQQKQIQIEDQKGNDINQVDQSAPIGQKQSEAAQWNAIRSQYFQAQQSIKEEGIIIEIIMKWVWVKHEKEFQKFKIELSQLNAQETIEAILKDLLQSKKQSGWKISQKYDLEQINQIIEKLIQACEKKIIQKRSNHLPNNYKRQNTQISNKEQNIIQQPKEEQIKIKDKVPRQDLLPRLEHRSNVSSRNQHKKKQSNQDSHFFDSNLDSSMNNIDYRHTPNLNKSSNFDASIFRNPFLKKTFSYLCRRNYRYEYTFDAILQAEESMNLNKWMVFCKQFNFIDKFHKKQLIDIYQVCTHFASLMTLQQFLHAVAILQQKYTQKYHTLSDSFISEVMELSNQAAFRVKMANLKVSYGGPTKNCFQYATYTQKEREQQKMVQKKYRQARKERQIVLIKGMFEDHIKNQVKQLKFQREKRKMTNLNNSNVFNKSINKSMPKDNSQFASTKNKSQRQSFTYSKLFRVKNISNTVRNGNKSVLGEQQQLKQLTERGFGRENNKKQQNDSILINNNFKIKNPEQDFNKEEQKNETKQVSNQTPWLTHVRSDSQESDEIFKEHLQIEKKIIQDKTKLSRIKIELNESISKRQKIFLQIQKQNDEDLNKEQYRE